MDKLNEYLQILLTTNSDELCLEPNKQPFVSSAKGKTELSNAPVFGTQISMMVFPLIPVEVRQTLPNQPEIEFVHQNNIGRFNFFVRKSPAGFNVTVRALPNIQSTETTSAANVLNSNSYRAGQQTQIESKSPIFASPAMPEAAAPADFTFETTAAANGSKPNHSANPAFIEETEFKRPAANPTDFANDLTGATKPADYAFIEEPQTANNSRAQKNYNSLNDISNDNFQPSPFSQSQNQSFVEQEYTQLPQFASASQNPQAKARMEALFQKMAQAGASDLHLSVSMPPMVRKDGKMQILPCGETVLTSDSMRELLTSIMPAKNREEFAARNDTDFAYEIPNLARFRVNIFTDRKGMGGVFRIIPTKILTAEQLGLSPAILNLCSLSKGLVVVTGPTGSGKSTTLCAMIDHINKQREDHIITIEDPIEFTHENQKCLVNQREVHNHTDSFKDALRAALREDPDILLVGEMRDLETISIAIETAETGHLVFGTLHTTTAASTVDRIIDQFPADRQQQIRVMLSESLKGVIAQTLIPKKGGGRVAALEILIVTPAISNLIREGKTFQIGSAMQTGKQHGMVMLNDALFALVQKGLVEPGDAYIKAVDKANFETMLTRGGFKV
jgi:twitching motility protein PilT